MGAQNGSPKPLKRGLVARSDFGAHEMRMGQTKPPGIGPQDREPDRFSPPLVPQKELVP